MKLDFLKEFEFFTGVPDSQLKKLVDYLMSTYGISGQHIIAANEGNSIALAAGYYLATGKVPVVYLQNSGIGNIMNPILSLMNDHIYGIPCVLIVGWRGEPGIHDEPQHVFQGEVTLRILEDMDIQTFVIDVTTTKQAIDAKMTEFKALLSIGKQVAFVVRKGVLEFEGKFAYGNSYALIREEAIRHIVDAAGDGVVVSTTGKASRELFEIREVNGQGHEHDFLTVGSMGHSSSIALGIALEKQDRKVWCIDGDGAALMHMGAMAVIGANAPANLVHIVLNNGAHETVGGAPTVAGRIDLQKIAQGCGYEEVACVDTLADLDRMLKRFGERQVLCFLEVKCALGARGDLGRPTLTPHQNMLDFMANLSI